MPSSGRPRGAGCSAVKLAVVAATITVADDMMEKIQRTVAQMRRRACAVSLHVGSQGRRRQLASRGARCGDGGERRRRARKREGWRELGLRHWTAG